MEISRISKIPPSYGARLSHSRASSIERTCHSQYPATSSFVSANGPSITVRFFPSNRTRFPCALGASRPAPTTTPALTSSSLNFWCAAIASGDGAVATSVCSPSLAMISTRITVSFWASLAAHLDIEWQAAVSTLPACEVPEWHLLRDGLQLKAGGERGVLHEHRHRRRRFEQLLVRHPELLQGVRAMAHGVERAVREARAVRDELLVEPRHVALVDRRDLAIEDEPAERRIVRHVLEVARHAPELRANLDEDRRRLLEGPHRRDVLERGDRVLEQIDGSDVGDGRDDLDDLAGAHAVLALKRVGVGVELIGRGL